MTDDTTRLESLGEFIRAQRRLANLSLRQMAELAHVSNPYLSQLERGLHEPSVRVLQSIAEALKLPPEVLLDHAGASAENGAGRDGQDTERAIRADDRLTGEQKQALLGVYRSYLLANAATNGGGSGVGAEA
jgi:transcriptional regulator with XRE-family HTH domain